MGGVDPINLGHINWAFCIRETPERMQVKTLAALC